MDAIRSIFNGQQTSSSKLHKSRPGLYEITYSSSMDKLPTFSLRKWDTNVVLASTGPNAGISRLDLHSVEKMDKDESLAGIDHWNTPSDTCYGVSVSLYEEAMHATDDNSPPKHIGDPIADVFASVVRGNNTIMAIADGSGWGKKPRLAARCAVRASIEHILDSTKTFNNQPTSEMILTILTSAMEASQKCINKHQATVTTLSIAVVCETANGSWGVFTLSLGDSRVYVYCPRYQTLMETTIGSHPSNGIRSTRDSGGALGPAIGTLPDLENLSFSYVSVVPGDFVILTTDGISDNFIPPKSINGQDESDRIKTAETGTPFTIPSHSGRLEVDPCCKISYELHKAIHTHHQTLNNNISAQTIALSLVNRVTEITEEKRQFHSNFQDKESEAQSLQTIVEMKKKKLGKLDHATVLSYQVAQNN